MSTQPAQVLRIAVCGCGNAIPANFCSAHRWIDEDWPTIGGGTLHVTICPSCRRGGRNRSDTEQR